MSLNIFFSLKKNSQQVIKTLDLTEKQIFFLFFNSYIFTFHKSTDLKNTQFS